jgi:2-polyprenyl-6-hydroxyphenyl methylase/3-demethylubiquinone-9 3-methyltransferase
VGAEYVLRWLPRGTHQWRKFVTPAEAADMLGAGGLDVIAQSGVSVNPLTRGYRLTDFVGVNYMLAARKRGDS